MKKVLESNLIASLITISGSQRAVAEALGVRENTLNNWLHFRSTYPTWLPIHVADRYRGELTDDEIQELVRADFCGRIASFLKHLNPPLTGKQRKKKG